MPKGQRITREQEHEILCCYIENGGDIKAATREAQAKGVPFAYGAIYNFIKKHPRAVKLTERFFDEEYEKHTYRRLSSVSAAKIQTNLEETTEHIQAVINAYTAETLLPGETVSAARLGVFSSTLKDLTKAMQSLTYIAVRFRDGLHAKQVPTVDMSQKFDQKYDFSERLPEGGYDALREYIERLKTNERLRNIPASEQGGNGGAA